MHTCIILSYYLILYRILCIITHFEVVFSQEGVGIKAREGLQLNYDTKIRRVPYSQVFPNLDITDFTGYNGFSKIYRLLSFLMKILGVWR